MKKKDVCRRMGAALLALLLCVSTVPALAADGPTFSDVDPNHWSYPYVEWAAERGFVKGVGEGRFNPNGTVTRAQFVTMIGRALDWEYETLEGDTWYDGYVRYANERGYFTNANDLDHSRHNNVETDKTSLNAGMPREEMALLTANTQLHNIKLLRDDATLFTDALNTGNRWHVVWCYERNIISGYTDGAFKGQNTITRAEACKVLKQIVEYYELHKDEREGLPSTTDVPQWHWCYDYLDWAYKEGLLESIDPSGEGKIIKILNDTSKDECYVTRQQYVATFNKIMPEEYHITLSSVPSGPSYMPNHVAAEDVCYNVYEMICQSASSSTRYVILYWMMDNGFFSTHNSDACQWGSYRAKIEDAEDGVKHGANDGKFELALTDYVYILYHLADHFNLIAPEDKIIEKDTRRNVLPLGVDTSAWINEPIKNLSQEQVELAVQSELERLINEYCYQKNRVTLATLQDAKQLNSVSASEYYQWAELGGTEGTGVWAHSRLDGSAKGDIGQELFGIYGSGTEIAATFGAGKTKTPTQLASEALKLWKNSVGHNDVIIANPQDHSRTFACGVYYKGNRISCIASFHRARS